MAYNDIWCPDTLMFGTLLFFLRYMKRLLTLVALLFGTIASVSAQVTTSGISGHITSSNGMPLAGALVVAVHTPSSTQYGTVTDRNGAYHIDGMRVGGPYSGEISYIGCTTERYDDIRLELGKRANIDAILAENLNI